MQNATLYLRYTADLKKKDSFYLPDLTGFSRIFIKNDNKVDYAIAQELQAVFETKAYRLNPNVTTKSNLIDYYSNIVSQVANTGAVFKSIYENEETTVSSTDNARQQVVGVSDEEELSNMIKFQNAYNASSRYINVIDQLLEHIINTLGA